MQVNSFFYTYWCDEWWEEEISVWNGNIFQRNEKLPMKYHVTSSHSNYPAYSKFLYAFSSKANSLSIKLSMVFNDERSTDCQHWIWAVTWTLFSTISEKAIIRCLTPCLTDYPEYIMFCLAHFKKSTLCKHMCVIFRNDFNWMWLINGNLCKSLAIKLSKSLNIIFISSL